MARLRVLLVTALFSHVQLNSSFSVTLACDAPLPTTANTVPKCCNVNFNVRQSTGKLHENIAVCYFFILKLPFDGKSFNCNVEDKRCKAGRE